MRQINSESLRLGAGLRYGADEAAREILSAVEAEQGVLSKAAKRLGIPRRTLARWHMQYPVLERGIGRIRARAHWPSIEAAATEV